MTVSVLILVQGYPSELDRYNLAYVHTRLIQYQQAGLSVTVLNFGAQSAYTFEGISVLSEAEWNKQGLPADLLISHAPNLRNHLRFLLGPGKAFRHWLFFFHGHEVLLKSGFYPRPYPYVRQQGLLWQAADQLYDRLKLVAWKILIPHWLKQNRLNLVFVSQWMLDAFLACLGLDSKVIAPFTSVIPNSIHPQFLASRWKPCPASERLGDFVTIRPLDNPKYAVDQVRELAISNPDLRFAVYGRGSYFLHYPAPDNLIWYDTYLKPEEMPAILVRYRAALMPTRLDAQGVMMCELASFEMPLLTSDLPICHEMLGSFPRVGFLQADASLAEQLNKIERQEVAGKRNQFAAEVTVGKELQLIQSLCQQPGTALSDVKQT